MKPVHIIGVPLDLGGGRRGVDMGPSAFRIAGIGDRIAALGYTVVDKGNLPAPIPETRRPSDRSKKYVREIAKVYQKLFESAMRSHEEGALPLILGGDHSLAAGSVAASAAWMKRSQQRPLGLIWIDAHGDMNTPETTTSGNVHRMPLAALLGPEPAELSSIGGFSPAVLPRHTVLVGVRKLDDREKDQIRPAGVHVFTMKDVDREGIARIGERAIALACDGTGGMHVSFDLDACDPTVAPGVGTPVKGGFNYRETHLIMEMVADCWTPGIHGPRGGKSDARHPQCHGGVRNRAGALGARQANPVAEPSHERQQRPSSPVRTDVWRAASPFRPPPGSSSE